MIIVFSSTAYAGIGKIVAARGDILVTRGQQLLPAKTGFELEKKDIVTTQAKAKAQILFADQTVITIGKNSVFKIEEYLYEEGEKPALAFNISKGAFRSITGKIGKIAPDRFKLKTKTATIGIRGTQILGDVGQKPETPVKIAFTQGRGYVQTPQGTVEIEAGQITNVAPGKAPTPPRAYKPTEINQMSSASGGGGETMGADDVIDETSDEPEEGMAPEEGEAVPDDGEEPVEGPVASPEGPAPSIPSIPIPDIPEVPDLEDPKILQNELTILEDVLTADIEDPKVYIPSFVEHLNDRKIFFSEDDPYLSWGAWIESDADPDNYTAADVLDGWVAGDLTPTSKVQEYIDSTSGATYNYTGDVRGVIDTGSAQELATGNVDLTFDFHNSDITGTIGMTSDAQTSMDLSVQSATITNEGFSIDSFSGSVADTTVASGSAQGNFYGSDVDSVGGKFSVDGADGVTSAYGVFVGKK